MRSLAEALGRDPEIASASVPTQIDVGRRPARSSISQLVDVAGLTIGASAISRTRVSHYVFNGYDAKVEECRVTLLFQPGTTDFNNRVVRGRWFIWLQQDLGSRQTQDVTVPRQIVRPGTTPFLLGSTANRIVEGRPVSLIIDYEAASGADPVFWDGALSASLLLTLT